MIKISRILEILEALISVITGYFTLITATCKRLREQVLITHMKNLLTRLGEQYVGVNICVDVTSNSELRRMFDALLNGKTTMIDYYTTFGRAVKYGTSFLLNDADVEYPCLLSMQDGELSLYAGYIVPDSRVLSVDDFIELYL